MRGMALFVAIATVAFAQDESGKKDNDESFEVEPPLLIPNRSDEPLPNAVASATPTAAVDVAQLERDFARARRNSAGVERLCKIGALSKVETEQRILRLVRFDVVDPDIPEMAESNILLLRSYCLNNIKY